MSNSSIFSWTMTLIGLYHRLDMITDVFNRLVSYESMLSLLFLHGFLTVLLRSCYTKCIGQRFTEADLNKGESVCVDRCVAKFFEVNKKVGEKMQAMGAAAGAAGAAQGGGFTSL